MSRLKLFLFGPPRIEQNHKLVSVRPRKALALLIYLAVTRQPHGRDTLATLFWPESDQQAARASLRRMLYQLTQSVDKDVINAEQEMVEISPDAEVWLDVEAFQQAAETCLSPRKSDRPVDAAHAARLARLVDLYTDDFLAGFHLPDCPEFDDWQFFQREDLRKLLTQALQQLVSIHASRGDYDLAISFARRWLALDVMHEPVHRELMRLYAQAGQQAAALRQYEECQRILDEELGVPPEEETTELCEAIRAKRFPGSDAGAGAQGNKVRLSAAREHSPISLLPPSSVLNPQSPLYNLPADPVSFIGREAELAQLHNLLRNTRCHLITLVGLGGIGKTQLALETARRVIQINADLFADGVVFVPLAEVETAQALPFALADALDLTLASPVEPAQQIVQFLRSKQMLLILDNVEHLLHDTSMDAPSQAVVELLGTLLETCPQVKLLVTSREPLQMQVEWRVDLDGLAYPDPATEAWPDPPNRRAIEAYDAIQLFVKTAQQVQPSFEMTPQNEAFIRQLCQLVAGMPLALKLAASWVRVLPCERIVDELRHGPDFLSSGLRDARMRQRSMRAVFDYTWNLLAPEEQQAFAAIAVFRGGFTEEAAGQVANASPRLLAGLLDRGLLQMNASIGGIRYQLHELIRQYAAEKMDADPEAAQPIQQRHSTYYLKRLQTLHAYLQGKKQQAVLEDIHADIENIRMAWNRALAQCDLDIIKQVYESLYRFYWTRCQAQEGKEVFAHAIAQLEQTSPPCGHPAYAELLRGFIQMRGLFSYFLGDYETASQDFHRALEIARQENMQLAIGHGFVMLGAVARCQAQRSTAEWYLEESLRIFKELGNQNGEADALQELAQLYTYFGEHARAAQLATESLTISRVLERSDWIAWSLETLGWISFRSGAYGKARQYYEESLALFKSLGHALGTALALGGLGIVAWALGGSENLLHAQSYLEESTHICRRIGHQLYLSGRLFLLAQICNDQEDYASAQQHAQEGLEIARTLGSSFFIACNLCCLAEAAYYQGDIETSRKYLRQAIDVAAAVALRPPLTIALFHLATSLVIESELGSLTEAERIRKQTAALALVTQVEQDPTCWAVFRTRAERLRGELTRKLPEMVVESAADHEQNQTLDAQLALLLEQEGKSRLPATPIPA